MKGDFASCGEKGDGINEKVPQFIIRFEGKIIINSKEDKKLYKKINFAVLWIAITWTL